MKRKHIFYDEKIIFVKSYQISLYIRKRKKIKETSIHFLQISNLEERKKIFNV